MYPWHTFSYSNLADNKIQAGIKITPCGGENSPHKPAGKEGRAVLWEESSTTFSVLCDSLGSSLVSFNLSLLVRISYIPDGQSPGYFKSV